MYLLEKHLDASDIEKPIATQEFIQRVDLDALRRLVQLAATHMSGYHALIQANRLHLTESVSQQRCRHPPFLWYIVVHDRLRNTIIGERFQEAFQNPDDDKVASGSMATPTAIVSLFVDRIAAFQQTSDVFSSSDRTHASSDDAMNPDRPTWVAPVKLDGDDPNTLFLHEKSCDSGADISSEDAHIFPPIGETLYIAEKKPSAPFENRLVHQDAESHVVADQRLWIVANYYETFNLFAVFDHELVSLEMIEQEMDRMCTFGGYKSTSRVYTHTHK